MNDVFIGCYSRPLDGRRLCIPSEWARVFRDGGGVVAVEHPNGNLVLTTKERAESAPDVELSKVWDFHPTTQENPIHGILLCPVPVNSGNFQ
jgi:hypothetical protein